MATRARPGLRSHIGEPIHQSPNHVRPTVRSVRRPGAEVNFWIAEFVPDCGRLADGSSTVLRIVGILLSLLEKVLGGADLNVVRGVVLVIA